MENAAPATARPIPRHLKWLSVASVISMFIVQLAGTLVTKSGSAEGCGASWPLCHGSWLPEMNMHSIIEYSHRVISGAAGILVLAMAIGVFRAYRDRKDIKGLMGGAVAFIVIQSALGAMAVLWPQPKAVLALHFGISLVAFVLVVLPTVIMFQLEKGETYRTLPVSDRLRWWVWAAAIYTYGVVYSGAYVRHTNSHMACLDWPLCNGALIPELSGAVGIQFMHRLAAAGALVVIAAMGHMAKLERDVRPDLFRGGVASLILIILQVLSGGWVILSRLTMTAMMVHSAIITALFGVLGYLCLQVTREPEAAFSPAQDAARGIDTSPAGARS
ncbi:MAG TPA: heme A synthase [Limnochordia bacterium]|nr:heme A synthase [Limnochordia bacterium]